MKFRVLAGRHYDGDKVYKEGDVIDTPIELDKRFANKFERIQTPIEDKHTSPDESGGDGVESSPEGYGKDMTDKFENLPDDIMVFKNKGTYLVIDVNKNEELESDTELTSIKKVSDFLISIFEEEDEEDDELEK